MLNSLRDLWVITIIAFLMIDHFFNNMGLVNASSSSAGRRILTLSMLAHDPTL
jgi:hypothetical protein